jgi:hypothetical protein
MTFLAIDINDIIKGAITASTNAIAVYLSVKYVGGVTERVMNGKNNKKRGKVEQDDSDDITTNP